MSVLVNDRKNRLRVNVQAVLLVGALALAEQSVVLPVIVKHFSDSNTIVGIFASLLRGGAIIMQLYAAFNVRNEGLVLPRMLNVFKVRFISWFSIGIVMLLFGVSHPVQTLFLFSVGLFTFSFAAGFGAIYYQELMGKLFTPQYRGKLVADQQIFAGLLSIISVIGVSGYILETFEAPYSFAYIFLISSLVMGIGFLYFAPMKEMQKTNTDKSQKSFTSFIVSALKFVKTDKQLRIQIIGRFLSYAFMLMLPFIILQAKDKYHLSGSEIAILAAIQMLGAMVGNYFWGKLSFRGNDKAIALISFFINILGFTVLLFYQEMPAFYGIFFIMGASIDGSRLAFNNSLLSLAPEEHRPAYVAINNNITALGLFLSIPGGIILDKFGFTVLNIIAILLLIAGFFVSLKLKRNCRNFQEIMVKAPK
jgi:MFS family permease